MTRFVALGDLHLQKGETLHPGRLDEQEAVLDRILTDARHENVDAVLLAGDLYDRRRPSPEALLAAERPLVKHRDENGPPVISVPGNHDIIDLDTGCGLDVLHAAGLLQLHREPGITTAGDTAVACLPWAPVSRLRAHLGPDVPADEVNQACAELLVQIARDLRETMSSDARTLLLTHFAIDGSTLPSGLDVATLREPVLPHQELAALGYNHIVAGHIHTPQRIGGHPWFIYTGSPLPLDFGEAADEHGYWLIDVDGTRFRPVESPGFVTVDWRRAVDLSLDGDLGWEHAYVRVKDTIVPPDDLSPRDLERHLLAAGARYAKVELTPERTTRARADLPDSDDVSDEQAFRMWLDAAGLDDTSATHLADLDSEYRALAGVA